MKILRGYQSCYRRFKNTTDVRERKLLNFQTKTSLKELEKTKV